MKECSLLMGLEEEEQNLLVDELDPNAMDVERWDLEGVRGGGRGSGTSGLPLFHTKSGYSAPKGIVYLDFDTFQ